MYDFIKLQFKAEKVTAEWVQSCVPKWITQKQADEIIGK